MWTNFSEERITSIFDAENGGDSSSETSVHMQVTRRRIFEDGDIQNWVTSIQ
jgi:hypothetical protein